MGTVTKALSLLRYFNRAHPLIGLSELARLSGMNKATVHRMMTELQAEGFVEQAGTGREYRLGPAFLRLAALREAAVPTRDLAHDVLADLSAATQETTHVSLLSGDQLTIISYAYSPVHGTRVTMEDAETLSLHATSSGLAVLAFSSPEFSDRILSRPLEKRTPQTETNPDVIRTRMADSRARGFSESIGGFEKDVHSHAAPLFDARQQVIGAMAVAAPTARMDDARKTNIRTELRRHAIRLTRAMGGFLPDGFERTDPA
ncbi:MAG: IclR family transcriptional regulator [Rhodobacterales bacterium]|nr:MAG: IclR family transcriptional regulator [Rhodobacterales bacterium]